MCQGSSRVNDFSPITGIEVAIVAALIISYQLRLVCEIHFLQCSRYTGGHVFGYIRGCLFPSMAVKHTKQCESSLTYKFSQHLWATGLPRARTPASLLGLKWWLGGCLVPLPDMGLLTVLLFRHQQPYFHRSRSCVRFREALSVASPRHQPFNGHQPSAHVNSNINKILRKDSTRGRGVKLRYFCGYQGCALTWEWGYSC